MRALFFLALLTVAGCATQSTITSDGLVAKHSGRFDELYLRPGASVSGYRRVLIEPVPVKFAGDYLTRRHGLNHLLAEPLQKPYQDPEAVAQDLATLMQTSLFDAFRAAGYEPVSDPGPGVMRISVRIEDLYINAPDQMSSTIKATFNRDTGQATLLLDASDSVTSSALARIVHHSIVREVSRANMANDTTNRFWLETAFRRWAKNVTAEFGAAPSTHVSLNIQR